MSNVKIKLPTFADLVNQSEEKSNENDLQVLLNQEPLKDWVKTNDLANGSKYLPIDKIEYLLTRIFIRWYVEVIEWKVIANSCCVHVRLHYLNILNDQKEEFLFQDGLGAAPIQTNKGAKACDFNEVKNAAVQMALPAAETYAIKDAAEKIGRIFGKDLNRKDLMNYENMLGRFAAPSEDRISKMILNAKTVEDLNKIKPHLKPEHAEIFAQLETTLTAKNGTH